ncbi:MAG: hypothetical protein K9H49_06240 [Bacteroidales bacterium]|nr:hypothetical protein [Bacteroidales bacterium]MCF8405065.1 hypothetical protein [Bacteroidales bacterium]
MNRGLNQEVHEELVCYPNPFKEKVTILQSLPNNIDPGNILIYNISGEFINKLKIEKSGVKNGYKTSWDGKDKNGSKVKPSIYYLRIDNEVFKVILTN